jgi:hypothetical protein
MRADVALYGCSSEKNCTVAVGKGNTGVYTDSNGQQVRITADDDGNVSVPCDRKDTIGMVAPTPSPEEFLF